MQPVPQDAAFFAQPVEDTTSPVPATVTFATAMPNGQRAVGALNWTGPSATSTTPDAAEAAAGTASAATPSRTGMDRRIRGSLTGRCEGGRSVAGTCSQRPGKRFAPATAPRSPR